MRFKALSGVEPEIVLLAQIRNREIERTLGLAIINDTLVSIFDPWPIAHAFREAADELGQRLSALSDASIGRTNTAR